MPLIGVEYRDDVAVVTLDRPPVNAVTLEFVRELRTTLDELAVDPPRGLVLANAGRVFCAGVDFKQLPGYSAAERGEMVAQINAMITRLYGFPTATAAAVGGSAIGAGLVLMLACDVRLVVDDPDVRLGLTEVTAGVSYPAGPMEVVKAEIEPSLRRRLVLRGSPFTPQDGRDLGLVDKLVAAEALLPSAVAEAAALARPAAYAEVKEQLRGETLRVMRAIAADPAQHGGLTS